MKKLTLSIICVAFLASCVMQKNACQYCIMQNADIIKSDTIFINDTVQVVSIKEGATITTVIDCDSIKNQTIYDVSGLSLKVQQGQGSKVLIKTVQQQRIDTVKTVIRVPFTVNYHADIALFTVISDSLNGIINTLRSDNKHLTKRLERCSSKKKGIWHKIQWFLSTFILLIMIAFVFMKIK